MVGTVNMPVGFKNYAPLLFIVGGASLTVITLGAIKLVYPDQSEYLPYQPACMLIGFGTAYWFGKENRSESPIVAYPLWGIAFALLSGFLGMQYLKLFTYIPETDKYIKESPWGVMNFVILVAQSFAIGGIGAEWKALSELRKSFGARLYLALKRRLRPRRDKLNAAQRLVIWTTLMTVVGGIITAAVTGFFAHIK